MCFSASLDTFRIFIDIFRILSFYLHYCQDYLPLKQWIIRTSRECNIITSFDLTAKKQYCIWLTWCSIDVCLIQNTNVSSYRWLANQLITNRNWPQRAEVGDDLHLAQLVLSCPCSSEACLLSFKHLYLAHIPLSLILPGRWGRCKGDL